MSLLPVRFFFAFHIYGPEREPCKFRLQTARQGDRQTAAPTALTAVHIQYTDGVHDCFNSTPKFTDRIGNGKLVLVIQL